MVNNHTYFKNMTPAEVLRFIREMKNGKEYVYIILGKPGPTGKSWLCARLNELGYNAIEISEDIGGFVKYDDTDTHFRGDHFSKHVTIVLNRPLSEEVLYRHGKNY